MAFPTASFIIFLLELVISVVNTHRILGGYEVAKNSEPHVGSVQGNLNDTYVPYCGCTLVTKDWAISAAHCWRPPKLIRLVFGEHNLKTEEGFEQRINVSKIYVHNFNYRNFDNDIMLFKLSQPAIINNVVRPVTLPSFDSPPLFRNKCYVSGWGVMSVFNSDPSDTLRAVDVELNPYCRFYYWGMITRNMICAGSRLGGKDSCQGDSGGALICNGQMEGIVSWGISCGHPYYPGVYCRVRSYIQWLYWVMDNERP